MNNQLELFEEVEILSEADQAKLEAMEYVARNIYRSTGGRGAVDRCMATGYTLGAFKAFDEDFHAFGFNDTKYCFARFNGKGWITKKGGYEFDVTSKQLFDVLVKLLEKLEQTDRHIM